MVLVAHRRQFLSWTFALGLTSIPAPCLGQATSSDVFRFPVDKKHAKPPVMTGLCLQPGGPLLATVGDDHCVRIWDRRTQEMVRCLEGHLDWVRAAAFSPDGSILATGGNDRQILFWDVFSGNAPRIFAKHVRAVSNLAFSPEGHFLAVLGFDDALHLYDVTTAEPLARLGCPCRDMRTLAFSPDGSLLAAGGRNGRIRVWRVDDRTVLHETVAHTQRIRDLLFTRDGVSIISAGEDRSIRLWEATTGREVFVLPTGACKVYGLTLLADGRLAAGGSDNCIHLWNLERREQETVLRGHTGTVAAVAADGDVLVSVSYDTTLRQWSLGATAAVAERPEQTTGGLRRAATGVQ